MKSRFVSKTSQKTWILKNPTENARNRLFPSGEPNCRFIHSDSVVLVKDLNNLPHVKFPYNSNEPSLDSQIRTYF